MSSRLLKMMDKGRHGFILKHKYLLLQISQGVMSLLGRFLQTLHFFELGEDLSGCTLGKRLHISSSLPQLRHFHLAFAGAFAYTNHPGL